MGAQYHILQNKHAVLQEELWRLVDKLREDASHDPTGPYLCKTPETAYRQALNTAAEELSDALLDFGDDDDH
jgi:hypothetical protein